MSLLFSRIEAHAGARPNAIAISGGDGSISYGVLNDAVAGAARNIGWRIAPARGPIAVALDNGPAWAVADLALLRLGHPSLPLPPFFTPAQTGHALTDSGAAAVLRPWRAGDEGFEIAGKRVTLELLDAAPVALHAGAAKITYTSGSTGAPKGVCLSADQMERTAAAIVETVGTEHAGVHVPVLPLGVLLENIAGLYATLMAGGRYHAPGLAELGFADPFRPDFARMAATLSGAGATSLILVPELLRGLLAAIARGAQQPRGLSFVAVGGARVSPDLIAAARAAGMPVYEGYGLTECASVVALNTPGSDRTGAVGRPLPHLKVSVGLDGEVVVSGQAFLGYVGQSAHRGPVNTGDLGSLDRDGFLAIAGRKSNTIITAFGRNVAPEWVESELLAQPEIAQAAVFGEARADLSAILVPSAIEVDDAALAAAVSRANGRLPDYARVAQWVAGAPFEVATGELTGNGRPRRQAIWDRRGELFSAREPS